MNRPLLPPPRPQIARYESERQANKSTYWVNFELLWRDYFRFVALQHGSLMFKEGGIQRKELQWRNSPHEFEVSGGYVRRWSGCFVRGSRVNSRPARAHRLRLGRRARLDFPLSMPTCGSWPGRAS